MSVTDVTKILRVFPRKTSMTPTDGMAFVGEPPLPGFRPEWVQMIHVSVTFTWDLEVAARLVPAWQDVYPETMITIGGPALGDGRSPLRWFEPGLFVCSGVTFTTRGCNNNCPWCLVPKREGPLFELREIAPGNVIQDNNLLQASRAHRAKVFAMLKVQRRAAVFSGGLDARLLTDEIADELRGLRIKEVFLAADTEGSLRILHRALDRLAFLPRNKRRVYVMVAYGGETIQQAEARLEAVWAAGGLPFCQLYQPADRWIEYPPEWKALHRTWSRPAAMAAMHKQVMGAN